MLDSIATVDIHLALIVYPGYPENDYPLRFYQTIENAVLAIARVFRDKGPKALHDFCNRLQIFGLARVPLGYVSAELLKTLVSHLDPQHNKTILVR